MQTAIITGSASGIGNAAACLFLAKGWRVVGADRRERETIVQMKQQFANFIHVQADISDEDGRRHILKAAEAGENVVKALVNAAGVAPKNRCDILEMTEESYDFVMNINTKGTFFLTQLVANHMIQNAGSADEANGAIVNISSLSAYTSSTSRGEYCISKAGVSMITKLFADRLAEFNITVNEIRPGIIATNMTKPVTNKYDAQIKSGLLPLARWGRPEDVAKAVYALTDGSFPYTTGQSIDVDGGFHIRRL
ncbi:3-ketoacyl-ACP reductase [Congzhengia sp.]|uniref:3-ketoacyl-ACP reductase n=1 Tax=Congzhengia sp. TaxID=2944168 RepID=UPI0030788FAF